MKSLIGEEEEGLILEYGSAHRTAIFVLVERRGCRFKVVLGIQERVAVELEGAAVELIRAALDVGVNDGSRVAAILWIQSIGDQAKLTDRVRTWNHQGGVQGRVVGIDAVNQKGVLLGFRAVAGESSIISPKPVGRSHDAWLQLLELRPVAAVQGQVHDLLPRYDGAQLHIRLLHLDRIGFDDDLFGSCTEG